jgi:hypothetical protein
MDLISSRAWGQISTVQAFNFGDYRCRWPYEMEI